MYQVLCLSCKAYTVHTFTFYLTNLARPRCVFSHHGTRGISCGPWTTEGPALPAGACVLGQSMFCRCAELPVYIHTCGTASASHDFGERDHGLEAHGLGGALEETGGSEETCKSCLFS